MSLANKLTFFRIILAPSFFVVYQLPNWVPSWFNNGTEWTVLALWLIFVISELTDLLDGLAARKLNQTSDLGKLLDPFADTLMQITCFLCFVIDNILVSFLVLLVIYRELCILMLRNMMLKKGIALGARMTGKIKTILYIITAGAALLVVSFQRLNMFNALLVNFIKITNIIFLISVIFSIISLIEYSLIYKKTVKNA